MEFPRQDDQLIGVTLLHHMIIIITIMTTSNSLRLMCYGLALFRELMNEAYTLDTFLVFECAYRNYTAHLKTIPVVS